MARLVPSLCFHTWTPERDSGYCLHLTNEALRGTLVSRIPLLGNCKPCCFRTPYRPLWQSVFSLVGALYPRGLSRITPAGTGSLLLCLPPALPPKASDTGFHSMGRAGNHKQGALPSGPRKPTWVCSESLCSAQVPLPSPHSTLPWGVDMLSRMGVGRRGGETLPHPRDRGSSSLDPWLHPSVGRMEVLGSIDRQ